MDYGRGGCCITRYGAATSYDVSKVDRIMLRFRPIAPKPATGTSSGGSSSLNSHTTDSSCKSNRGKRKHANGTAVAVKKPSTRKRKTSSSGESHHREQPVVTLPLLPEKPEIKPVEPVKNTPLWLNFGADQQINNRTVEIAPSIGSCVTIECVTDTWLEKDGLGKTDEEKMINLEQDTCPGFISDGYGRVTWTNEAYRQMMGGGGGSEKKVMVWLAMKENVAAMIKMINSDAFTCRVTLQKYTCTNEKRVLESVQTLPCDVWRMDCGGFAWWLDVKAALRLGR
ncbi:hypothetical protein ACFE04_028894 [Oxalis oulophora]